MKKLVIGLVFSAIFGLFLHAVHPHVGHAVSGQDDCGLCQVVTFDQLPVVFAATPKLESHEAISTDLVVIPTSQLSLLADPRGPPLV